MPTKICRIYLTDGVYTREDSQPVDINHLYIRLDLENPVPGEAWLYDGPFPEGV